MATPKPFEDSLPEVASRLAQRSLPEFPTMGRSWENKDDVQRRGANANPDARAVSIQEEIPGPATDIQNMKFWVPIEPKLSDVINRSA
jgi:hypothetical protein